MAKVFPQITVKVSASRMDLITTCVFRTLSGKLITGSMTATVSAACIFLEIIEAPSKTSQSCSLSGDPGFIRVRREQEAVGFGSRALVGYTQRDLATTGCINRRCRAISIHLLQ